MERMMGAPKTYWHLEPLKRVPTEYEIVSSRLLYYPGKGFEVNVPMAEWYRRFQTASPFAASDWERFRDPRETTYAKYTALQSQRETYVDGLLESIENGGYDARLAPDWVGALGRLFAPLLFPLHGLEMAAAYVGSMAPSGRVAIAALFQSADEMRRIQRFAYRLRLLQRAHPGLGDDRRALWQSDPAWQPLREAVERLLVTYDWGEAFTALNLCLKPAVDALVMERLQAACRAHGDYLTGEILGSLADDCRWHREWASALVAAAEADRPGNRGVISDWLRKWDPVAAAAVAPLDRGMAEAGQTSRNP